MQKIKHTISLEAFKTRYPLTYPSISNARYSFVEKQSLKMFPNANYNTIPLGIDENICGTKYENFTEKMGELYGGKVIDYITLDKWYREFLDYYALLYSNECHGPYNSATDYYNSIERTGRPAYASYAKMDENFNAHGGKKFYKWLTKYYFISLDFMNEYFVAVEDGLKLEKMAGEWLSCVNNLPNPIMYYPDVCEFYGIINTWHEKFSGDITEKDCCDYIKYKSYGGEDLYIILKNWIGKEDKIIGRINSLVNTRLKELTPSISIDLPLKKKVEDLGNFVSFSKEFVIGREYSPGCVCMYNNNVYILLRGRGFVIDENTGIARFDSDNWMLYSDYYKNLHAYEFVDNIDKPQLSGRTVSSLDSFERATDTVDNIGNTLEGYFEPSKDSNFIQPAEDTLLDLKYEIGKAVNVSNTNVDGQYVGDLLYSVDFYYKDHSGNIIEETVTTCHEGEDVLESISSCQFKAISTGKDFDETMHSDFTYYKGCIYEYVDGIASLVKKYGHVFGLKCIDRCTLEMQTGSYWLNYNESYPVRYYKVNKDIEEAYSYEKGVYVEVAMCDWFLEPSVYEDNGSVVSPAIRKEELLGYSMPETLTNNIYIDRGYSTVLDKHLKMGEISSLEALEKYGNGSFNIINLEEETI